MDLKNRKINVAIQVLPEAKGKLRYELVDAAINYIQSTGLKHLVCPFETVVECNYAEFAGLLQNIHLECAKAGAEKMLTNIKLQVDFMNDVTIEDKMEKYS